VSTDLNTKKKNDKEGILVPQASFNRKWTPANFQNHLTTNIVVLHADQEWHTPQANI
jgi:hypothetical protein